MAKCVLESGTRHLPVPLEDAEKIEFGERAGMHQSQAGDLTAELKSVTKDYKGKIEQEQNKAAYLLTCLRVGKETREVRTEIYADFAAGLAITIRLDTGEEIGRRPLTGGEMQRRFDFETDTASARFDNFLKGEPAPLADVKADDLLERSDMPVSRPAELPKLDDLDHEGHDYPALERIKRNKKDKPGGAVEPKASQEASQEEPEEGGDQPEGDKAE